MNRIALSMVFLFTSITFFSQEKKQIQLGDTNQLVVKSQTENGFIIQLDVSKINLKTEQTDLGVYVHLTNPLLMASYEVGKPNIPVLSKLIQVPQGAEVSFHILNQEVQIIDLSDFEMDFKIIPAVASLSKSESRVMLTKDESVYQNNAFFNPAIASYEEVGQLRANRLGRIEINPIQYNPVANRLKIMNHLEIEVRFENPDWDATRQLKDKYTSTFFDGFLQKEILNPSNELQRAIISQAPMHMVIVSDRMFEAQLAPFITWKIKKGFKITTAFTDEIGTTTTAIKNYLQQIYEGDDPMSFVLLVGDVDQIPAWSGSAGSHITDLRYCEYTGDDMPEVFYGRFSAQNPSELQPQIDKTLMYEQFTMPDPSYLSEVFLVAGDDSSHEMTWGNGQLWYGENYYFNNSNSINPHTYLQPLDNDAVHNFIISDVNAGVSFANYTAHCSSDGWASPSFSVSDVSSLNNNGKYGLWVGNCCESVTFQNANCFGEAALRKENGGSIGYIGGSNSTYWDEDYWWGTGVGEIVAQPVYENMGPGMYDGYWHQQTNEVSDTNTWFITQGQMLTSGNLAVASSTSSLKQYYWEIYHLMGDPSVMNYIGTPENMTVNTSPSALLLGMTSLQVNSVPYAYVALSQNGVLITAALSDNSGVATLTFEAGDLSVGEADLVVTAQNHVPQIGTITVSPADEPYVVLENFATDVPPVYTEDVSLHITLKNVATTGSGFDAQDVAASLATTDPYITLTDIQESYGNIVAGASQLQEFAYSFTTADQFLDGHQATFTLTITDNASHTWNEDFQITLLAPEFSIHDMTIDDASGNNDGILDPGETANLLIETTQTGHADVANVIGSLICTNPMLTLNTDTTAPTTMAVNNTQTFSFNVTADSSASIGTSVDMYYTISGGLASQFENTKDFQLVIGFVPTYCEAGSDNTTDEFIQRVQFNTIDNSSAQGPSYTDYTAISTDITIGESYPITITNGEHYSSDQMGCWIDWNYDGDFDDTNESFDIVYGNPDGTGTIIVPADAHLGPTRMRLRVMYTGTLSSCGNASYGEVEDYTVNVQNSVGYQDYLYDFLQVYPNPNTGDFTISLKNSLVDTASMELYNMAGQRIYTLSILDQKTQIHLPLSPGMYLLRLTHATQTTVKKIMIE